MHDMSKDEMNRETTPPADRTALLRAPQWLSDRERWAGHFDGRDLGTGVTVVAFSTDEVGAGPSLHVHPYDELFVLIKGHALVTIGERRFEAGAGDVVLGPAEVPHKYHNLGPEPLETIDIHLNDRWIQTDLDDPEAESS